MRNPEQKFGSEIKLRWVVQREVIHDQNKSGSSDQARAGTRTETWVCMRNLQQDNNENETEMKKLESRDWDWTRSQSRGEAGL